MLVTILNLVRTHLFFPNKRGIQTELEILIVYQFKIVFMFYCRNLSADEFRGHFLKDMKKTVFLVLELKKIFRKRVDLTKQKHEPMCKLNIMKNEISLLCPVFEKRVFLIPIPRWLSFCWFI